MINKETTHSATVSTAEFAYLLNLVSAEQIIGVDNDNLFPKDEAHHARLLADGFDQLVEKGWLSREDRPNRYNLNNELMLLVAVIANPELTMMSQRYFAGGEQIVTYYLAEGRIVEQVRTDVDAYCITNIPSFSTATNRLIKRNKWEAAEQTDINSSLPITISRAEMKKSINSAKSGNVNTLQTMLTASGCTDEQTATWSQLIVENQPTLFVEWGVFVGNRLVEWRELLGMGTPSPQLLVQHTPQTDQMSLTPFTISHYTTHLQTVWDELKASRQTILQTLRERA